MQSKTERRQTLIKNTFFEQVSTWATRFGPAGEPRRQYRTHPSAEEARAFTPQLPPSSSEGNSRTSWHFQSPCTTGLREKEFRWRGAGVCCWKQFAYTSSVNAKGSCMGYQQNFSFGFTILKPYGQLGYFLNTLSPFFPQRPYTCCFTGFYMDVFLPLFISLFQ